MMRLSSLLTLIALMMFNAPAFAVNPDEVLSDPVLEERAREISAKLRCLVCQNQSIDDSDAQLAKDLRVLVRERLVEGDDDEATVEYIVARYGEYVLLQPRFGFHTLFLWVTPIAALGFGVVILLKRRRKPSDTIDNAGLSDEEESALKEMLNR